MLFDIHHTCLSLQNHSLTKALSCGQRLPPSEYKDIFLALGLIHIFVISGAHAQFIKSHLQRLKCINENRILLHFFLFIFTAMSNFSPPILSVFFRNLLKDTLLWKKIFCPRIHLTLIASLCSLPFSLQPHLIFSLTLSTLFSVFFSLTLSFKTKQNAFIYLNAMPIFIGVLGVPHPISIPLISIFSFIIGFFLTPLSLMSLFSNLTEKFTIQLWWELLKGLDFLNIFLNYPVKPETHFENTFLIYFYLFIFLTLIVPGSVYWKRKSFFA